MKRRLKSKMGCSSKYSPWDLPALSAFRHSNLQCFLRTTTPSLPPHAQSSDRWWWEGEDETRRLLRLRLREAWRCYEEWSAYGAAVPILLPSLDTTVQYYSPSLSALQIFTTTPFPSSDSAQRQTFVRGRGYLYCQYNEICSPYDRGPVTQKINELAMDFPGLMELSASHLSPYSWMAVAWYPLYQIPTVMNEQELSASFLTYHRFSFSSQGPESIISDSHTKLEQGTYSSSETRGEKRGNLWLAPFGVATYKLSRRIWINPEMSDQQILASYQKAAVSWLDQVHFHHHDFNFMFPMPTPPTCSK